MQMGVVEWIGCSESRRGGAMLWLHTYEIDSPRINEGEEEEEEEEEDEEGI
jgi:hypothetical protein